MNHPDIDTLSARIASEGIFIKELRKATSEVIVGQEEMLDRLLIGLLARGHVLLEGLPGLAKTLAIKTLAAAVDGTFQRIQFTPDLLPADIIGTMIYQPNTHNFAVRRGPIFANFVLADEINRAPAKVQSALLEAMQERQVTINGETHKLEEPFLVLATQNPIEQEGTYLLPEAQTDRFMLKINVSYPTREEEREIIRRNLGKSDWHKIDAVVHPESIINARKIVREVYVDEKIEHYILDLVFASRDPNSAGISDMNNLISYGASPRAGIYLARAAQARAFMDGRAYVIPEDIRYLSLPVLRHRIGLTYEAEAQSITADQLVTRLLDHIAIP